jgi:hypothetical protein
MSTRATIGLKRQNGTIDTIICWHDAFIEEAGHTLKHYYDTQAKVEELLSGGNLEELGNTPAESNYQYQGDDGVPDDCKARTLRNVDAFTHQVCDFSQDYGYLFQDGQWFYYRPGEQLTPMQQ